MKLPTMECTCAHLRSVYRDCTGKGRRRDERRAVLAYRRTFRFLSRPIEGERAPT